MAVLTSSEPNRWPRRLRLAVLAVGLAAAGTMSRAADPARPSPAAVSPEYQIKAGQLFHFTEFVEWPASAFHDAHAPLVIGVLGDDPFDGVLDELVRDEKVDGHPLVARRYRRIEDVVDCHILFVSRSESAAFPRIFARLQSRCILTVGDADDFLRAGGIVRFVIEDGKVRQQINPAAAKAAGLTISSMLLRVATLVTPPKE